MRVGGQDGHFRCGSSHSQSTVGSVFEAHEDPTSDRFDHREEGSQSTVDRTVRYLGSCDSQRGEGGCRPPDPLHDLAEPIPTDLSEALPMAS